MSLIRNVGDLRDSIGGVFSVSAVSLDVCRGGYDRDSDSFPDSEPYEEDIFCNVRREDRICAQCGKDHSFQHNFKDVKTSIECIPELIPLIFKEDSMKNV